MGVMSGSNVSTSPAPQSSPSSGGAAAAGAASASLDTLALEHLACFHGNLDRDRVATVLQTSDAPPVSAYHESGFASGSGSGVVGEADAAHGRFLLRTCTDPAERLPSGAADPDVFVLCYNRHGAPAKSKVYRLLPPHAPAPSLSLGRTAHRLFPSLQALVTAVVGPNARPVPRKA